MHNSHSGAFLKNLINSNSILPVAGVLNAYCAILAVNAGFNAIYLSGAGVANSAFGLPDLGVINITDLAEEARRITNVTNNPLIVDLDTGGGSYINIQRAVKLMEQAGVAAVHIEDQVLNKRCGHRANKQIISIKDMGDRIKAALDSRKNDNFLIIARTDAFEQEGLNGVIERAEYFKELGADLLFPDAIPSLDQFKILTAKKLLPVLANMTEFGKTQISSQAELQAIGVAVVLYPLSAFRVMAKAAAELYKEIIEYGTQEKSLSKMQTRQELYTILDYEYYEKIIDMQNKYGD